ncbi:hypothetical protein GIB67_041275 [Kingdonia uniflora]|uniref:non-specific serine/threonine protein kinase n=1 Tax=Kingdonia uniflora TaxID=39325 RepID=A0A7J7NJ34_9MAGN|nr:hypothetical protein GIB67_041275 [Kingdonia uniflora]
MSRQAGTSQFHKSKTLDNKYMLGDEIGKGAYGRVYKGLDLQNGDFVAIKQVSLENIAQEDLNIIMNLNHKNIVKYLGSLKTKTHLHIILEYVENGSLANIIKPNKFGPFPEYLVAFYIAQVLEGLVYLHEQGVIHRDIKGANILITKEGLVKLADFGVATKLTEADVNTHSVVGTPYWMAPEVIEMSGVCAASDIWSVGCTVIELLTCVPPYYDLQPMPALFRIVQDEHPPISDSLSPDITDFLRKCFQKDARQRPDAKTLLLHSWIKNSHSWIQNSRRALQSSLRQNSGTMRNIPEDSSVSAEISNGDNHTNDESSSGEKLQSGSPNFQQLQEDAVDTGKSNKDNDLKCNHKDNNFSDQDPNLASREKLSIESSSGRLSSSGNGAVTHLAGSHELSKFGDHDAMGVNGEVDFTDSRRKKVMAGEYEGKVSLARDEDNVPSFGPRRETTQKDFKPLVVTEGHELSRFSDGPGDSSLDDLFIPLDRNHEDQPGEASTSASSSHMNQSNAALNEDKNDLATKLKARIAKNRMENEKGQPSGDILRLFMEVVKEDVINLDSLVFDEKFAGGSLFPQCIFISYEIILPNKALLGKWFGDLALRIKAVEFSRLVGLLKPDESEDAIVSSCQKLSSFFNERPEQKMVFVTQHGLLPLMELLLVPKNHVICSVLQILNQIIKDNTNFQENACLIGLIPVVMSFAIPDRPRDVRMQAAYFLQQLCQSSSLTLQMFIACGGIPVLVGFLEADYAKYREMVHLAIDGMWQVFMLQRSTPRNDFCRIAAKNGILLRLINTLHSLNEATRLATSTGGGYIPADGSAPRPRSGPLDSSHPISIQCETLLGGSGQTNLPKVKHGNIDQSLPVGAVEPSWAPSSFSQRPDTSQQESSITSKLLEPSTVDGVGMSSAYEGDVHKHQNATNTMNRISTDKPLKQTELVRQQEQVRPLLSLLDKEPPSRRFSGQLEYVRHLSGLERHETILPLLHSSAERKPNGELDFLMAEFAEVSGLGREHVIRDSMPRVSHKASSKKLGPPISSEGAASTSGVASQTASGLLSGSGVLNARPGSTTSSGLLSHMVYTFNSDVARDYLEKVADLLLEFSRADTTVKSSMCTQSLLSRLFQMFNRVEPPILLKLMECINHLSTDPNCLESLQRADAIKHLIPNLEVQEGQLVSQIHHEVLNALFNLCKINKRRQEQAAENGIIPHLMHFIMSDSLLKQYALPLLCDMAHASRNSREQLRAHGGLDVYLSLLDDELWSVTALDSLALMELVDVQYRKSSRINTTLAVNGLTPLLIARLDHRDAIARLNLLKLIKAVYEHHPRPKQLIVENDLPQKLQNLIEERRDGQSSGGQVLVKQMATALLKALHINTVL